MRHTIASDRELCRVCWRPVSLDLDNYMSMSSDSNNDRFARLYFESWAKSLRVRGCLKLKCIGSFLCQIKISTSHFDVGSFDLTKGVKYLGTGPAEPVRPLRPWSDKNLVIYGQSLVISVFWSDQ